jgi:hypothetical protein
MKEVAPRVAAHVGDIFGLELREAGSDTIDSLLRNTKNNQLG